MNSKGPVFAYILPITIIIVGAVCLIYIPKKDISPPIPAPADIKPGPRPVPPKLSPKEILLQVTEKWSWLKKHKFITPAQFDDLINQLNKIHGYESEYQEAQKLIKLINKERVKFVKENIIIEERNRKKLRESEVAAIERSLLLQGINAELTIQGKNKDILKMKYALINKSFVVRLQDMTNNFSKLRELGFQKIIFTDGFHETWILPLTRAIINKRQAAIF